MKGNREILATLGIVLAALGASCGGGSTQETRPSSTPVTMLAAGDIAECDDQGDEQTAALLAQYPEATIATLGDNAYQHGTPREFEECYGPTWGQFVERTYPATGNHDFATKDAQGYYDFFGERGGRFDEYYYSYDLGAWHVVVLNSDCWRVDGCEPDDRQMRWLRDDLEKNATRCTLAYWHRPPFSSGRYGDPKATDKARPLWEAVVNAGVDIVLVGHEHSYERFAPMNAAGDADENGTLLVIVGTGGGNLRPFRNPPLPTTEARNADTWGVLKLDLRPDGYDFEFLPVAGKTFTDSGSGVCH